ncbi:hypothetical protein NLG97_g1531 [Lecanicillium saksenae]|uniref:Uncharacterized protein n=1 Tax=Lecanicillium saksenae TaxID=468837 RepID=A0ACC1R5D3_9HYPO|nr:hypothetical protein NLG97_g1531 [Lecanicillium saksenae]
MDYFQSEEFDTRVKELMEKFRVPGLSMAAIHGEKTASKQFGVTSIGSGTPCTVDSLFDIASSSKVCTAIAVGLLVEDDVRHPNVTFDTPVSKVLPEDFVMSDPEYTKNVTVDDMLGHRSGLAGHDLSYFGTNSKQTDDARSVTRNLRNLQVCAPIRSKYVYNNIMYTVATHLVETETKKSFSDFVDERIFKPLEMSSSSVQPSRSRQRGFGKRISSGHAWSEAESRYREFPPVDSPEAQGAGSIVTSAVDYLKLVKAFLHQEGPITKQVYESLTKIRSLPNPSSKDLDPLSSPKFYCAGLGVVYYRGHAIIGHNGGVPGFGSRFFFVPSLDFGIVMLGNAVEAAYLANAIEKELVNSAMGSPNTREPNLPKPNTLSTAPTESKTEDTEPQKMPLTAYTGHYWNPGYRGLQVQIKDEKLFIDASDRSFQSLMVLHHVSGQTKYRAHIQGSDAWGGMVLVEPVPAEFLFDNDRATKIGIQMDENLSLIWFDRVYEEATPDVLV